MKQRPLRPVFGPNGKDSASRVAYAGKCLVPGPATDGDVTFGQKFYGSFFVLQKRSVTAPILRTPCGCALTDEDRQLLARCDPRINQERVRGTAVGQVVAVKVDFCVGCVLDDDVLLVCRLCRILGARDGVNLRDPQLALGWIVAVDCARPVEPCSYGRGWIEEVHAVAEESIHCGVGKDGGR